MHEGFRKPGGMRIDRDVFDLRNADEKSPVDIELPSIGELASLFEIVKIDKNFIRLRSKKTGLVTSLPPHELKDFINLYGKGEVESAPEGPLPGESKVAYVKRAYGGSSKKPDQESVPRVADVVTDMNALGCKPVTDFRRVVAHVT